MNKTINKTINTRRFSQYMKSLLLPVGFSMLAGSVAADEMWVSNEKSDTVVVIDTDKLEVIRKYKVGDRPRGITFSKDYKQLYICASDSDAVQVMDVASGEILYDLPSGEDPEQHCLHLPVK